jgi:vesicle-fusing ATPase
MAPQQAGDSYGQRSPGRPQGGAGSGYGMGGGYGAEPKYQQSAPSYQQQGPPPSGGRRVRLRLAKIDGGTLQSQYIFSNISAVSPNDFPRNRDGSDIYVRLTGPQLRGDYVVTCRPLPGFPDGCISLSDPQRTWCGVGMMDELEGEMYDPFSRGPAAYLGSMDLEVGFASTRKYVDTPYDGDELADMFIKTFQNQVFAPGQRLLMDVRSIPLSIVVRTVTLVDLTMTQKSSGETLSDPGARGILTNQCNIDFFKDVKSPLKLKASSKRPAANAILKADFKFEAMGVGGLDDEFSTIFRRAFASRLFPPGIVEKLGIMHVKGMLLYGPPGTGKTLIARQLGKVLNAREPKVINGPEVLNKYVGQSEENIRKLFADAEKEYKEKGDESGLHIIIFDELDAVCKQRGSGAGGGTGVGDSVVNQLLSKLDGVDQLNNILLIGMTNRKDMIDDALLRPGRLEVQVEISLPDENGRSQILKIHTSKMKDNNIMGSDVNIDELAALTKNFSGAELSGLVKSAASFAFARNTKPGTVAVMGDDVANMKVTMEDFLGALTEVRPAFGADGAEFEDNIKYGIIDYSRMIKSILDDGLLSLKYVRESEKGRHMSVLIHGPPGSGKTALASHLAMHSEYPFMKLVTPASLTQFGDEVSKKDFIRRVFVDAYKSSLSLIILDDIESMIEWNPVGPRFSNTILRTIVTMMRAPPPKGHRLLVLVTSSRRSILSQLDIVEAFDSEIPVPAVEDLRELGTVLKVARMFDPSEISEAIETVKEYTPSNSQTVGLGIKTILTVAEKAKLSDNPTQWFAEQLATQIMKYNTV